MSKKIKLIIFLLGFLLLGLFFKKYAQENAGLSISPPSFEINALPEDTIENVVKIENLSSFPLKIIVKPQNFVAYGEGGQVNLTEEENSFSISKWIKVDKQTFNINPKDFQLVNFKIKIPKNAEPGSHYGAIVFSTTNDEKVKGSGAGLSQELASLILIKLPGDVIENAKLISFKPLKNTFTEPEIKFNALIENTGNVHIKPYGFISIKNIFGKKIGNFEIKGKNILPASKRIFEENIKFEKIGYFKAELTLLYSGGGKILKSETNFIALNIPKTKKYIIIISIFAAVYLLFFKRINKALKIIITGK